jgi:hypothetical protein
MSNTRQHHGWRFGGTDVLNAFLNGELGNCPDL